MLRGLWQPTIDRVAIGSDRQAVLRESGYR
jgi:hypothetical protein